MRPLRGWERAGAAPAGPRWNGSASHPLHHPRCPDLPQSKVFGVLSTLIHSCSSHLPFPFHLCHLQIDQGESRGWFLWWMREHRASVAPLSWLQLYQRVTACAHKQQQQQSGAVQAHQPPALSFHCSFAAAVQADRGSPAARTPGLPNHSSVATAVGSAAPTSHPLRGSEQTP